MSAAQTRPERCAAGGALGLCALALLQKFADWQADVEADDDNCEFLNGTGWDDLARLAADARTLLAQMKVASNG